MKVKMFNISQLMVFAGFCFNNEIHDELHFSEPLKERCIGENIFSTIHVFFNKNNALWRKCSSTTTDGVASLTSIKKGFRGKVTEIAAYVKFIRCSIRKHTMAAKMLEPEVHKVLQDIINMINVINQDL